MGVELGVWIGLGSYALIDNGAFSLLLKWGTKDNQRGPIFI